MKTKKVLFGRLWWCVLPLLLSTCFSAQKITQHHTPKSTVLENVVVVETPWGHGTGFFIDSQMVVTNRHVVGIIGGAVITFANGAEKHFLVEYVDSLYDIALLRITDTVLDYWAILRDTPKQPVHVSYTGHPEQNRFATIGGMYIPGERGPHGSSTYKELVRLFILPGASGAAVYTDDQRVIGMVCSLVTNGSEVCSNRGYFVPSQYIIAAMEDLKKNGPRYNFAAVHRLLRF